MTSFPGFGGRLTAHHPNPIIAKREMQRQERLRLRRLLDVKPSAGVGQGWSGGGGQVVAERPRSSTPSGRSSAQQRRIRPTSGPPSALRAVRPSGISTNDPTRRGFPAAASGCDGLERTGARRCFSEVNHRIGTDFLVSSQRRLRDAQSELQMKTTWEQQALFEEIDDWYFRDGGPCIPTEKSRARGGDGRNGFGSPSASGPQQGSDPLLQDDSPLMRNLGVTLAPGQIVADVA